jgi:hypothetical protein
MITLALISNSFRACLDSPFGVAESLIQNWLFYRERDDCRDKEFPVPATGLSGVQNPLNTQDKLSFKKPAREVAFPCNM